MNGSRRLYRRVLARLTLFVCFLDIANAATPVFTDYSPGEIEEGLPPGTFYYQFKATDPTPGDVVTYSLDSSGSEWFNINSTSGVATVKKTIDREVIGSVLKYKVKASDGSYEAEKTIFQRIKDINDNPPVFTNLPKNISIKEDFPVGSLVFTVSATDADSAPADAFVFFIETGNEEGRFELPNPAEGKINLKKSLDYDDGTKQFVLRIIAKNTLVDPKLNSTSLLTISITDVDDLGPKFVKNLYEAIIVKDSPPGTLLTTVQAIDGDSFNDAVEYKIYQVVPSETNPGNVYEINNKTGNITVNGPLTLGTQTLVVMATSTTNAPTFTVVKIKVVRMLNTSYTDCVSEGQGVLPKISLLDCQGCQNGLAVADQTITLLCNATGKPIPNITWMKNGEYYNGSSLMLISSNKLVFKKFAINDAGRYTCIADNGVGNPDRKTIIPLLVNLLPKISLLDCQGCQNGLAVADQTITLLCNATGKPIPNITWMKNGEYYNGSSLMLISSNKLVFKKFAINDAGKYTCIADNGVGNPDRKTIALLVNLLPKISLLDCQGCQNGLAVADQTITLLCNATGKPIPNITWMKNGEYYNGSSLMLISSNKLVFKKFAINDAGRYTCIADNGVGNPDRKTIALLVNYLKDNLPIPATDQSKTLVLVLGILFALSIVLNIIFIAGFIWLRTKDSKGKSKNRSKNSDERGQMNDISLQETSFTDNATPNVPVCEPIRRRGLATRNTGIPEYDAVTTRTQQAQPQSRVQTNNPMPQYDNTDRDLNPPPVTYQTIQPRTGNYASLSPLTRIPPKDKVLSSTGNTSRTGEYQALQHEGLSPQYQSLDDLSKC